MDRWERKNTRSSRMAGQTNRRTCICDSTAVGQLCTINKVIHLPQKLFENLHENPDGHRMTYPVSSSIRLACNKNLFAFKYLCPGLGNRYSFLVGWFRDLGFCFDFVSIRWLLLHLILPTFAQWSWSNPPALAICLPCISGAQLEDSIEWTGQHCDVSAANGLRVNNTGLLGQQCGGSPNDALSGAHPAGK